MRRIAELEAELERATAALRTQGAMLRGGLRDQAAKLARAREVQALAAADFATRLAAMENEISRLLQEVDLVRHEQESIRGLIGPLHRLRNAYVHRVTRWLRARPEPVQPAQTPAQPKPKRDPASTATLLLRGFPSQVLAWKKLLGQRR